MRLPWDFAQSAQNTFARILAAWYFARSAVLARHKLRASVVRLKYSGPLSGENAMGGCNRHINSAVICIALVFAGVLNSASACRASDVGVIVPAYFYPGTGGPGGVGDGWADITAAASQVPVTAVFNPDSGPLPGPADPNYVNAMTNLENASGKVVAYVFTDDGSTPLATVESQISTYITQYGSLINGLYLDGMSVTPSTLSYYQSIDSYIKGLNSSYTVVGNPGQPFLNGVTPTDYLSTGDIVDIFEGPNTAPSGDPGFNNYPYGLNWFESYPSNRFDNTIYDVPTASDMEADLSQAAQLNAGYVYITDLNTPNPYAQLPSYWDQEVAAIVSLPEPGVMVVLPVVACGLIGARRAGRTQRPLEYP
jgi:hypothetical protein